MPEPPPRPAPTDSVRCVLLAQRHPDLGVGIRGLLGALFDHVVIVADEPSLIACAARLRPSVAVVDLSLTPGTAITWLTRLRDACPDLKLVLLSAYGEPAARELAARAGAVMVLDREVATALLPAIDRLLAGAETPAAEPAAGASPAGPTEPDLGRP